MSEDPVLKRMRSLRALLTHTTPDGLPPLPVIAQISVTTPVDTGAGCAQEKPIIPRAAVASSTTDAAVEKPHQDPDRAPTTGIETTPIRRTDAAEDRIEALQSPHHSLQKHHEDFIVSRKRLAPVAAATTDAVAEEPHQDPDVAPTNETTPSRRTYAAEDQIETLQSPHHSLQKHHEDFIVSRKRLHEKVGSISPAKLPWHDDVHFLQVENKRLRVLVEASRKKYLDEMDDIQQRFQSAESQRDSIKARLAGTQKSLVGLQATLDNSQRAVVSLEEQHSVIVKSLQAKIDNLTATVEQQQKELQALKSDG